MTCQGRSQQLPDEIYPHRERCAAWQGKLSNEESAITWKCGFEIYQFGHLQTIYTHDQVIVAAAQCLISWRNLYKRVWMMALQDRDGAELNVLGRQPHASWLSHCLPLRVQNHQSKLILWKLHLKEKQGASLLHYQQTHLKICISKPKPLAHRGGFPKYSALAPNSFFRN